MPGVSFCLLNSQLWGRLDLMLGLLMSLFLTSEPFALDKLIGHQGKDRISTHSHSRLTKKEVSIISNINGSLYIHYAKH